MANRYPDYDRDRYSRRWEEDERPARGGRRDDRGFIDRAGDEVRSWFGDEEAERRRRIDEREGYTGGSPRDFGRYREGSGPSFGETGRYGPDYGREGTSGRYGTDDTRGFGRERSTDYGRFGEERYRERGSGGEPDRGWRGETRSWGGESGRGSLGSAYGDEYSRGYGSQSSQDYGPRERTWGGTQSMTRGRFSGRGPANYQRSDDRIREDVNDRLTDHPDIDATFIEVTVRNCEVTLAGTVDSRHAKRLAEDVAESVSGVKEVQNQIRVQQQETGGGFGTTTEERQGQKKTRTT